MRSLWRFLRRLFGTPPTCQAQVRGGTARCGAPVVGRGPRCKAHTALGGPGGRPTTNPAGLPAAVLAAIAKSKEAGS